MNPVFFPSAAAFHAWLEKHHAEARELWLGFFKRTSGRDGITYAEAVDEALCFGWIDGIVKRLDEARYVRRFTPRRPVSNWSRVNIARVERLARAGRMHAAGLAAFAARDPARSAAYSFEAQRAARLPPALAREFRGHRAAWRFFSAQAPSYQRLAIRFIVSGKQPETRARRLQKVIAASAAGRRL